MSDWEQMRNDLEREGLLDLMGNVRDEGLSILVPDPSKEASARANISGILLSGGLLSELTFADVPILDIEKDLIFSQNYTGDPKVDQAVKIVFASSLLAANSWIAYKSQWRPI